jgi:hypothetical protein
MVNNLRFAFGDFDLLKHNYNYFLNTQEKALQTELGIISSFNV